MKRRKQPRKKEQIRGRKMRQNKTKKSKSLVLRIAVAVFTVYVVFSMVTLRVDIAKRNEELATLAKQCEEQKLVNQDIERLISLSDDNDYIEKIAREMCIRDR